MLLGLLIEVWMRVYSWHKHLACDYNTAEISLILPYVKTRKIYKCIYKDILKIWVCHMSDNFENLNCQRHIYDLFLFIMKHIRI